MTGERLLTAVQTGELLGLSPATILDRFERGDLPGFRLFGKKGGPVRFRLSEIEAAVESWRVSDGSSSPSSITCGIIPSTTSSTGGST